MKLIVNIKKKLGSFYLYVDFVIENETFAILGASGSGKSMTLKCIAGIETPDEGHIILNDRILFDSQKKINLSPQERHVGYLFQDYALFPNMTVANNIMAGMGRNPDREIVQKMVKQFHLEGLEKRYPAQLSGGQKQRVALARMMASEPDVILLDEPFSALDTYLRWEMEREMRELLDKINKPVILVSHNRNEVYRLCQTVSCMEAGHMEKPVSRKLFFHHPKTKTAAILSGCKNISRAEKVDDTHVFALDWNMTLTVPKIQHPIEYVGIRAHSFKNVEEDNIFALMETRMMEEPFEWNVSFLTETSSEWIHWKMPKEDNVSVPVLPKRLYVKKEDILLLR